MSERAPLEALSNLFLWRCHVALIRSMCGALAHLYTRENMRERTTQPLHLPVTYYYYYLFVNVDNSMGTGKSLL
jgi:hypothetical protein